MGLPLLCILPFSDTITFRALRHFFQPSLAQTYSDHPSYVRDTFACQVKVSAGTRDTVSETATIQVSK